MALKLVRDALALSPAVVGAVGQKIYPLQVPEGTAPPYVSLHRLSANPENSLQGFAGLDANTVSVDCWASDYLGLLALRDAVRARLYAVGYVMQTEIEEFDYTARVYHVSQHWLIFA